MFNELNRSQITRLAISYLGLKTKKQVYPSTRQIMCQCPFHKDNNPSMGIDIEQGVYNCFSCGSHGNIEQLFRELTGDDLYKTLGIRNDPFSNFARNANVIYKDYKNPSFKKKIYMNINWSDFVKATDNLLSLRYILRRGISKEVADSMGFLYCKETRINTTLFKNRVCVPVYEDGILCSMEGRKIISEEDGPKVLYPKNTSVDLLYDIDNLDIDKPLYACEGLMDLSVMRSCKTLRNSTSIFGANITNRQIEQLSHFKKVVYIPDSDRAGEATVEMLKESGLDNIYILRLPPEVNGVKIKDIGDLPKAGSSVQDLVNRKFLGKEKKLELL